MTTEPNADVEHVAAALWGHNFPEYQQPKPDTDMGAMLYGMARAAIAAMADREVTVQEAARVFHKELISRLPEVQAYNDPIISSLAEFYTVSGVVSCFAGDKL